MEKDQHNSNIVATISGNEWKDGSHLTFASPWYLNWELIDFTQRLTVWPKLCVETFLGWFMGVKHIDNTTVLVSPVTCLDPGLSNCTTQIVMVNINGDEMENIHPTQQLGEILSQATQTVFIKKWTSSLKSEDKAGVILLAIPPRSTRAGSPKTQTKKSNF